MPYLHGIVHELTPRALAEVDNEMHCEIIKEVMTTIWKAFPRLAGRDQLVAPQLFEDLQLLLGVSHQVLLRCVLESLLVFLQW